MLVTKEITMRTLPSIAVAITAMITSTVGFFVYSEIEAHAAAAKETRKTYQVTRRMAKFLNRIEEASANGNYAEALQLVEKGKRKYKKNQYIQVLLWNWVANIRTVEDGPDARQLSIAAMEQALSAARKTHPERLETDILYSLSATYFEQGDYEKALSYFREWGPRDKPVYAGHLAYAAQLFYSLGNYGAAANYIADSIAKAEKEPSVSPQPLWTDIAVSANWEIENYGEVERYLRYQLTNWPEMRPKICSHYSALKLQKPVPEKTASDLLAQACGGEMNAGAPSILAMQDAISWIQAVNPNSEGCLPIVRVQPQYPRRAQERGIQGYAVVAMDAQEDGWVDPESVRVIDAQPEGYFDKSVIKAAQKMRYKTGASPGEPECRTGMTYRFSFNLAN